MDPWSPIYGKISSTSGGPYLVLCCGTVFFPGRIITIMVDGFFQQVKRALTFWAKGIITKKEVLDSATLKKPIHYKPVLNESSGVTSTSYSKFSGDNWKDATEDFARYARGLRNGQFEEIIMKAQPYLKSTNRRGVAEDSSQDSVVILVPRPRPAFSDNNSDTDSDEGPEKNPTPSRHEPPRYRSSSLRREAAFYGYQQLEGRGYCRDYDFGDDRTPAWSRSQPHGPVEDLVRQYYLVNLMMK